MAQVPWLRVLWLINGIVAVPTNAPTLTPTTSPTMFPTRTPTTSPTMAPTDNECMEASSASPADKPCGNGGTCDGNGLCKLRCSSDCASCGFDPWLVQQDGCCVRECIEVSSAPNPVFDRRYIQDANTSCPHGSCAAYKAQPDIWLSFYQGWSLTASAGSGAYMLSYNVTATHPLPTSPWSNGLILSPCYLSCPDGKVCDSPPTCFKMPGSCTACGCTYTPDENIPCDGGAGICDQRGVCVATASPTVSPTANPTTSPPTATPTLTPTALPTDSPPSDAFTPSLAPTGAPTIIKSPTKTPTDAPSEAPSVEPSPTSVPTTAPTTPPTSLVPTAAPTTGDNQWHFSGEEDLVIDVSDVSVTLKADEAWDGGGRVHVTVTAPKDADHSDEDTASDIVSVKLFKNDSAVDVTGLTDDVVLWLPLRGASRGTPSCVDKKYAVRMEVPICSHYDDDTQSWQSDGCARTNRTEERVECTCDYLTDFALRYTKSQSPKQNNRSLTAEDVAAAPACLVVLCCLYLLAGLALVLAYVSDHRDADERLQQMILWEEARAKKAKEESKHNHLAGQTEVSTTQVELTVPESSGSSTTEKGKAVEKGKEKANTATLWNEIKSRFLLSHAWIAIAKRRRGANLSSVDRVACLSVLLLTTMLMSAMVYGQVELHWAVPVMVIAIASCTAFVFHQLLQALLERSGARGYRSAWERDNGLGGGALDFRLPAPVRWIVYVLCVVCAVIFSWLILVFARDFDNNPASECKQGVTGSWMLSVLLSVLVDILVIRPIVLLIRAVATFYCGHNQQRASSIDKIADLEDNWVAVG